MRDMEPIDVGRGGRNLRLGGVTNALADGSLGCACLTGSQRHARKPTMRNRTPNQSLFLLILAGAIVAFWQFAAI